MGDVTHVILSQCLCSNTLPGAMVGITRELSGDNMVLDLLLPVTEDGQRADWS